MLSACGMCALVAHAVGFRRLGYVATNWHKKTGGIAANFFAHFNFKVRKVLKSSRKLYENAENKLSPVVFPWVSFAAAPLARALALRTAHVRCARLQRAKILCAVASLCYYLIANKGDLFMAQGLSSWLSSSAMAAPPATATSVGGDSCSLVWGAYTAHPVRCDSHHPWCPHRHRAGHYRHDASRRGRRRRQRR